MCLLLNHFARLSILYVSFQIWAPLSNCFSEPGWFSHLPSEASWLALRAQPFQSRQLFSILTRLKAQDWPTAPFAKPPPSFPLFAGLPALELGERAPRARLPLQRRSAGGTDGPFPAGDPSRGRFAYGELRCPAIAPSFRGICQKGKRATRPVEWKPQESKMFVKGPTPWNVPIAKPV